MNTLSHEVGAADVNDDRIALTNLVQAGDVEDTEDRGN